MLNFCDGSRECDDGSHGMNDAEFKRKYRVLHPLRNIFSKIENNVEFKRGTRGPAQMPVKNQVILPLHFWERRVSPISLSEINRILVMVNVKNVTKGLSRL
jgi:hypothetical protein